VLVTVEFLFEESRAGDFCILFKYWILILVPYM